jgi:hypothetical protein
MEEIRVNADGSEYVPPETAPEVGPGPEPDFIDCDGRWYSETKLREYGLACYRAGQFMFHCGQPKECEH